MLTQSYLQEFLLLFGLHCMAMMTPGPDFLIVSRNALNSSRLHGIATGLGISVGLLLHLTYTLAGLGFILAKSPFLFSIFKYLGCGFLLYIAISTFLKRAKPNKTSQVSNNNPPKTQKSAKKLTYTKAFRNGVLTNAFNPKVTLFFFSLYNTAVSQTTPMKVQLLYALILFISTVGWFSLVALFFSMEKVHITFNKYKRKIDTIFAGLLSALAIQILMS